MSALTDAAWQAGGSWLATMRSNCVHVLGHDGRCDDGIMAALSAQPGLFTVSLPVDTDGRPTVRDRHHQVLRPPPAEFAEFLRRNGFGATPPEELRMLPRRAALAKEEVFQGWAAELATELATFVHVVAPGYVVADATGGVRLKWTDEADETAPSWLSLPPWPAAVARFAEHEDRLLPAGLPPHVELSTEVARDVFGPGLADAQVIVPGVTGQNVTAVPAAALRARLRALLPKAPAVAYLADHTRFDAAAHRVRRRLRAGLPPLETDYRRLIGGFGRLATFGVEVEFHAGTSGRSDDGRLVSSPEIERIGALLFATGLARDGKVFDHGEGREPGGVHRYSEDPDSWRVELEEADGEGEVVSPILRDTPQAYDDLRAVCAMVRDCGGHVDQRHGGHVHVGVLFGTDVGLHARHLARFHARQWLYFRLSTSSRADLHRGTEFCTPLGQQPAAGRTRLRQLRDGVKRQARHPALKVARSVGRLGDSVEHRHADGSLDVAEWWTRTAHAAAGMLLTLTAPDDQALPRPQPMAGEGEGNHQTVLAASLPPDGVESFRVQVHAPEPSEKTRDIRRMLDEYPWPRLRRHLAELYHLTSPYGCRRPTPVYSELPVPYDVAGLLGLDDGTEVTDRHRQWLVAVLDYVSSLVGEDWAGTAADLHAFASRAVGRHCRFPMLELGDRLRVWDELTDDPDTVPTVADLARLAAVRESLRTTGTAPDLASILRGAADLTRWDNLTTSAIRTGLGELGSSHEVAQEGGSPP